MQAQDGPAEFFFRLWPTLEKNKNALIGAGVAIAVVCGIAYFMSAQKAQNEVDAGLALTTLMTSQTAKTSGAPMAAQLQQLAGKYSGTAAGQRAGLMSAGTLFEAGNYVDAQAQFQKFLDGTSTGPFAATAELGIGASLEAQGKLDLAAAAYQRVISAFPDSNCLQPAQFALGRIAEQQNKLTEAMTHYQDVMRSGPNGSVAQEAMMRASDLKTKLDAMPKPAASTTAKPAVTPAPAPMAVPQPAAKP